MKTKGVLVLSLICLTTISLMGTAFSQSPYDLNADGDVNIVDAIELAKAFGAEDGDTNWNPDADFNLNGRIDILDAIALAAHFGQ